jgi:hypothetical protein
MIDPKKKATALTAIRENIRQDRSYCNSVAASMAKLQIGEILLCLQWPLRNRQRDRLWYLFEMRLRRYLEVKRCGGEGEYGP